MVVWGLGVRNLRLPKLDMKRLSELFGGNTSLLEKTSQRTDLQLAMVGNNAARRTAAHNDVATASTGDDETEPLQGLHDLGPGHNRQFRHVLALQT